MAATNSKYDDEKRFSKDNVSLAQDFPVKYATFNAYQMRDLIIRKLIEDPSTRDQVYPGSNIAILVDLVATMYQTLTYQLNHAASESMFSQSQYYENIVRIAKLLGYNAKGITPSTAMFRITNAGKLVSESEETYEIPPFACIATQDKFYSYCPSKLLGCQIPKNLEEDHAYDIVLHNGKWRRYQTIFTPNGSDFETFVMPMVRSEMDEQKYATTTHVFAVEVVKKMKADNPNEIDWTESDVTVFHPTQMGLFKGLPNTSDIDNVHNFLYNGLGGDEDNVFNVELNEIKQLVLKFGDGVTTRKLTPNSDLYVFYLETQGMQGGVQPSDAECKFKHNAKMFDIPDGLYQRLFHVDEGRLSDMKCIVLTGSTSAVKEEGVEEIRERAPHWFKMNNRLVTKEDYEFFVMNEPAISSMFNSVKVMNNWEYVATFYRWLNQLGIKKHDNNPRFYLNSARFTKYGGASLSDAVDSNNVYIWYITNFGDVDDINYDQMVQRCKSMMLDMKDMCHEPVLMPAIPIKCEISSVPDEDAERILKANGYTTVPRTWMSGASDAQYDASWLEVRINDDYSISSHEVAERVCSLFQYFFNVQNRKVGFGSFNTNDLVNLILEKIPAVSDLYTAYQSGVDAKPTYTHGISMAAFCTNTNLIDLGDDLQVKSGNIVLQPFMYPVLYTNTEDELKKRIRVVNKNVNILSRSIY